MCVCVCVCVCTYISTYLRGDCLGWCAWPRDTECPRWQVGWTRTRCPPPGCAARSQRGTAKSWPDERPCWRAASSPQTTASPATPRERGRERETASERGSERERERERECYHHITLSLSLSLSLSLAVCLSSSHLAVRVVVAQVHGQKPSQMMHRGCQHRPQRVAQIPDNGLGVARQVALPLFLVRLSAQSHAQGGHASDFFFVMVSLSR